MDDAAQGLRPRVPGRRFSGDASRGRRVRPAQVDQLVPRQPVARTADGAGHGAALRRLVRAAAGAARRRVADCPAHRRSCGTRRRDPWPRGRGRRDGGRRRRQRQGRGADVPGTRARRRDPRRRRGPRRGGGDRAGRERGLLAGRRAGRRRRRHRHARQEHPLPRGVAARGAAREPDGRRRARQVRDRGCRARPRVGVLRRLGQASHAGDLAHAVEAGLRRTRPT